MSTWLIYLLRCNDGTLYTGITTDLPARVRTHNAGKGAKYTRGRGPVEAVWSQVAVTRSQALILEARLKKYRRTQKETLIVGKGMI